MGPETIVRLGHGDRTNVAHNGGVLATTSGEGYDCICLAVMSSKELKESLDLYLIHMGGFF